MAPITVERKFVCASDPAALWCIISDTERLNRSVGLGPITLSENDDDSAARYLVETVSGGFPLSYEERPFEWTENEAFTIRRHVRKGAVEYLENSFLLAPRGKGSEVTVRIITQPRYLLLSPVIKLQVTRFVDRIVSELKHVDSELAAGRQGDYRSDGPRLREDAYHAAAEAFRARVSEPQREACEHIIAEIKEGADAALDRMRPFELAERFSLDPRHTLSACLNGVVAGLLELRWDIVCPSCRTAADRIATLGDIGEEGHCQLCDIHFDLSLDRSVEATFRPARGIRLLDEGPYCIGGPARTPHVIAQAIVAADGDTTLRAPSQSGRYRLFMRGGASGEVVVKAGSQARVRVEASPDGDAGSLGEHEVAPGADIVIHQRGGSERHVKLERVGWTAKAAYASIVATIPEFRRQFASEALRPGSTLRVGRVSLLFTDLTSSTLMYRNVGDARAFRIVQDHFDLIQAVVDEHGGAVVKTMGDAVMAAFTVETDALRCALALHERFPRFRSTRDDAALCFLKAGVYSGPCYAVTANGILDYFGQTVNIAARLQSEAGAGELVMTAEMYDRLPDDVPLAQYDHERFDAYLKGVGEMAMVRIAVDPAEPAEAIAPRLESESA